MDRQKLRVAVAGARGKLGSVAHAAFSHSPDIDYAGGLARKADPAQLVFSSLGDVLERKPDVWFDALTLPDSFEVTMQAAKRGARPVIGTSGWNEAQRNELAQLLEKQDSGGLIVPNFSLGAILMMRFAEAAAPFFAGVEIVETHRDTKKDKPSGTAAATAKRIAAKRSDRAEPPIHSIRLPGALAHQEVLFGGTGELLTIRHDSLSYESFVTGMLLAVKTVLKVQGLVIGLDSVLLR